MHIQYIHCIIEKDASTRLPMCVPFYEYAILSAVHNRDTEEGTLEMVHIDETKGTDEGREIRVLDPEFDVDDEFSRMLQIYGKNDNAKYVRAVYRDEDAFENAIRRNAATCEDDIADGLEVSEEPPVMTQNPPPKRRRRKRLIAKGESLRRSRDIEADEDHGSVRRAVPKVKDVVAKKAAPKAGTSAFRQGAQAAKKSPGRPRKDPAQPNA